MKTGSTDFTRIIFCVALALAAPSLVQAEPAKDSYTAIDSFSPDPSYAGEEVTIEYTVWGDLLHGPFPTGDVTVSDGTNSCTGAVVDGSCTITFDSAGAKNLTATYGGDDAYNGSISPPESLTVLELDEQADTTTTIIRIGSDSSVVGEEVSLFFEVTSSAGSPTGEVTISDGVDSCTGVINEPYKDKCTIIFTDPGTRELTATYAGDEHFHGSTSAPELHTVARADTTTEIVRVGGDETAMEGDLLTYTVTVTVEPLASGIPTGTVTLHAWAVLDSERPLGTAALDATGQAILSTTEIPAGFGSVTVEYSGDTRFNSSTDAMFQTVKSRYSGGGGRSGGGGLACGVGMITVMPFMLLGVASMKHRRGVWRR